MLALVIVIRLGTRQREGYQFAILLNLVQVEIIVSRYGISNLTPGSDQRFLLFLHTRSEQKKAKYPCKLPFHGAKVANIL